jgi:hypothetical protein
LWRLLDCQVASLTGRQNEHIVQHDGPDRGVDLILKPAEVLYSALTNVKLCHGVESVYRIRGSSQGNE